MCSKIANVCGNEDSGRLIKWGVGGGSVVSCIELFLTAFLPSLISSFLPKVRGREGGWGVGAPGSFPRSAARKHKKRTCSVYLFI